MSRKNSLISEERLRWLLDVYRWLLRNFGGWTDFSKQRLVLPTAEFFPISAGQPNRRLAGLLFAQVKAHARLIGWDVRLESLSLIHI